MDTGAIGVCLDSFGKYNDLLFSMCKGVLLDGEFKNKEIIQSTVDWYAPKSGVYFFTLIGRGGAGGKGGDPGSTQSVYYYGGDGGNGGTGQIKYRIPLLLTPSDLIKIVISTDNTTSRIVCMIGKVSKTIYSYNGTNGQNGYIGAAGSKGGDGGAGGIGGNGGDAGLSHYERKPKSNGGVEGNSSSVKIYNHLNHDSRAISGGRGIKMYPPTCTSLSSNLWDYENDRLIIGWGGKGGIGGTDTSEATVGEPGGGAGCIIEYD